MNGTLLGTVDTTSFAVPAGGSNILFGMADTNLTTNTNATQLDQLQFTLIDNVVVIPEPGSVMLLAGLGGISLARRKR